MNPRPLIAAASCIILLGSAAPAPAAPSTAPLAVELGPGSWISLSGTSTLHGFTSRSTRFTISAIRRADARDPADPVALIELAGTDAVQGATVDIPVRSLLSGERGLDRNLWKTLKSDEYPRITYEMSDYALESVGASDTVRVRVEGSLEVAGVQRSVPLDVVAVRDADGVLLDGTTTLRMSVFGLKPPRLMLGALRVGDRVAIRFHLSVVPRAAATPSPATAGREVGRP